MTDEELSKQRVPVYKVNEGGLPQQVGEKTLTRNECKTLLKKAQDMTAVRIIFEVVANTKGDSFAYELVQSFCEYASYARSRYFDLRKSEFSDLQDRQTIPFEFEDDPVLSRYICPITGAVIRHPVVDPVTLTLYERDAILGWLERSQTSPLTKLTLSADDLLEATEIQVLIDDRLKELQRQLDLIHFI